MTETSDFFQEQLRLFDIESDKLQDTIESFSPTDKSIDQIIQAYYQIMTVSSIGEFLKQNFQNHNNFKTISERIDFVENTIEKFDKNIHPEIRSYLTNLVDELTRNLQSPQKLAPKSKESIKQEAELYAKLREVMSTKEFVEQYGKGLDDD